MDITYVPMRSGFLYLTAIIDLYSRFVIHWKLGNSMEARRCRDLVAEALEIHQVALENFNTDQRETGNGCLRIQRDQHPHRLVNSNCAKVRLLRGQTKRRLTFN